MRAVTASLPYNAENSGRWGEGTNKGRAPLLLKGRGLGLEALKRERRGQHAIRINDQWRVCFVWDDGNAFDVEITDYH